MFTRKSLDKTSLYQMTGSKESLKASNKSDNDYMVNTIHVAEQAASQSNESS